MMKHMEVEAGFEKALKRNAERFGQRFKSVFQHMDWRERILSLLLVPDTDQTEAEFIFFYSTQARISMQRSGNFKNVFNETTLVCTPHTPMN